jgi:hypothetical protein
MRVQLAAPHDARAAPGTLAGESRKHFFNKKKREKPIPPTQLKWYAVRGKKKPHPPKKKTKDTTGRRHARADERNSPQKTT